MSTSTRITTDQVLHGISQLSDLLSNNPNSFAGDNKLAQAIAASLLDNKDVKSNGPLSITATTEVSDGVSLYMSGDVSSSADDTTLLLGSNTKVDGGNFTLSKVGRALFSKQDTSNININGVRASGAVTSASLPAYSLTLFKNKDSVISNYNSSGFTGGIELTDTDNVKVDKVNFSDMKYHQALNAGGYGVLLAGSRKSHISGMYFKAGNEVSADGYSGRHGVYVSTYSGKLCEDTVVTDCIFDYMDKTTQPAGAINIRANNRAIYSKLIVLGTGITGICNEGNISSQIMTDSFIVQRKYADGPRVYAHSWGTPVGANVPSGNTLSNSVIAVVPMSGIESTNCFALEVAGNRHKYNNLTLQVPDASSPVVLNSGSFNLVFNDIQDPQANGTAPFFLVDGSINNISISNIQTKRPLFSNYNLISDLTVDFARTATVYSNGTSVSITSDPNQLLASVAFSGVNIVINFRPHVTQKAIDCVMASLYFDGTATPVVPVVTSTASKSVTVRLYSLGGTIANPSVAPMGFKLNIFN